MPVIKEKQVSVRSVIENLDDAGLTVGEAEVHETTAPAFYRITEEGYTLSYREVREGQVTVTDVRITPERVILTRHGAIESEMVFAEGACHESVYGIPPYRFDMRLTTRRIRSSLDREGGTLALHYRMNIGGQEKACRLTLSVL